ncbi:hypothetical protein [Streptomyces sp. NPDC126503]|uniref:hypothetical protein n=1 Tax=Streptomyces sp. NPDC126503 TaxID=3155315 RepID=UPI00332C7A32
MPEISRIRVDVQTASETPAKTTSRIYLGFGGREFRLRTQSSPGNDFAPGARQDFYLGADPNVAQPERNDPREPRLPATALDGEVYLRLHPAGDHRDWVIERARVHVFSGAQELAVYDTPALRDANSPLKHKIWLGDDSGHIYHLERQGAPGGD